MSGISSTTTTLPPTALGPAPTSAPPIAPTTSTTAPVTIPTDQAALEQPSPDYPNLLLGHVVMLQIAGTPAPIIAQINADLPTSEWLDGYITGEIFQNLEAWDAFTGNPPVAEARPIGTARAGVERELPGVTLPAPGQGTPGFKPDGTLVNGLNLPGVTKPLITDPQPTTGQQVQESMIAKVVIGAAMVGGAYLLWRHHKRSGGQEQKLLKGFEQVANHGFGSGQGFGLTSGGFGISDGLKIGKRGIFSRPGEQAVAAGAGAVMGGGMGAQNIFNVHGGAWLAEGMAQKNVGIIQQAGLISALGHGPAGNFGANADAAAAMWAVQSLGLPLDPYVAKLGAGSMSFGVPIKELAELQNMHDLITSPHLAALLGRGTEQAVGGASNLVGIQQRVAQLANELAAHVR